LKNQEYPIAWLNSVDPANEGLGLIGDTVVRMHDVRVKKGINPWSGLKSGDSYYIANPDPDQQAGSCEEMRGTTDSYAAKTKKLRRGAEVMIQGLSGKWIRRDYGGGLSSEQLDIYIGEGGAEKKAQADAWGAKKRWVINLLNS